MINGIIRVIIQMENVDYSILARELLSAGKISSVVLRLLSQNAKDKIVAGVINKHSGIIAARLNQFLCERHIPFTVAGVAAALNKGVEVTADIHVAGR